VGGGNGQAEGRALTADLAVLVGRVLIALLFLGGAVQKGMEPGAVQGLLAGFGMPEWLVWPALAFNLGAGLALIAGVWVRPVAAALAAYCAFTSIFHYVPADPWQMTIFVKNWAIAGGCLVLAAHGPGRFALRP
jgi:putative oxidoreductase